MQVDERNVKPLVWWEIFPYLMMVLMLPFVFFEDLGRRVLTLLNLTDSKVFTLVWLGFAILALVISVAALVRRWNDPVDTNPYP